MSLLRGARLAIAVFAFLFIVSSVRRAVADVVFSEIHYHPPGDEALEFVELLNTGSAAVQLDGWRVSGAVDYVFPGGARIDAGARVVVARDRSRLLDAYPGIDSQVVFGDFAGALSNDGEPLVLESNAREVIAIVAYDDALPWDEFADGVGPSLELVCLEGDPSSPDSWRAGRVPQEGGVGGTPARAPDVETGCPAPARAPSVHISEIHYHPVLEEWFEDRHEFVEIHNSGETDVSLAGWRLTGGIDYRFPDGATIASGGYVVVAKNRAMLAQVEEYDLSVDEIFGDYERLLSNDGNAVALVDADGNGVEFVRYTDEFPWPIGADALGAGESWLPPSLLPLERFRFRGRSLERASFAAPASRVSSWDASTIEGPTPGRPNSAARAEPLSTVVEIDVTRPDGRPTPIRDGDEVTVRVRFEPRAPDGPVRIERFVDIITRTDEEIARFDLVDDGTGADREAGDLVFSATLPGDPENSIIRYRIVVGDGEDAQVLSPRPSDPFEWHAWFVEPRIETTTRTYQLFITPVDWALMWTNIQGGRVAGCNERPLWDAKVPAVFVFQGRVYDVQVRYQGSRWNRTNGRAISRWSGQRPAGGPLLALSWRIAFPRYREFEGRGVVTLNKLTQGCPGYNAGVGYRLFALADVPSPFTRFVRFHVNGNYYHYMMEYERPDEDMIERYNRLQAEKYPDRPLEPVGHLFKAAGCNCDEGPFGWGDMRILQPHCGHSAEARYAATYDRKTHEWDSYDDLIALIEGLNAARRAGVDEIRAFFEANFDMELLLNYLAIINWSVPFDDMFQNHFIYQRRSDGKWLLAPWDLDQNFGEWKGASASIYMGEQGNPDNRSGWWHLLKDAFLKAYREEFRDHLLFMNNTILHPDNIDALVDIVTAESNPAEAAQSPAGVACSFPGRAASFKAFARQRFEIVNRLAGATVEAGEDQVVFVGETVQFDGSESTPDASDVVTYEWSNGMTGERPTAIFEAPGTYVVTLTVKVQGIPFQDDVTIDVLPMPQSVAIEENGLLVLEAEDAFSTDANGAADVAWTAATEIAGASGAAYLEAKELERRRTFLTRYAGIAPEARYAIRFETPGTYRVWVRALASSTRNDSLHLNLRSVPRDADFALELGDRANGEWVWQNESRRAGPLTIEVAEVGLSFLTLWMRESGLAVDKVVVTQDETFVPEGLGPDASRQGSPSGDDRRFIRGDVDGNGKLQIVDPVRILAWLYRGGAAPECEDWADADDNGAIEIADAVYLLDSIFRRGSLPPAPFGTPGFDPTPDEWSCGDS